MGWLGLNSSRRRLERAEAHLAGGRLDEARALFEAVLEESADALERGLALGGLAWVDASAGDWSSAGRFARSALAAFDTRPDAPADQVASAARTLAISQWQSGEREAAHDSLERALEAWPHGGSWRAERLAEDARLLLELGEANEALARTRAALAVPGALDDAQSAEVGATAVDAALAAFRLDDAAAASRALLENARTEAHRSDAWSFAASVARNEARFPDGTSLASRAVESSRRLDGVTRDHCLVRALWEATEAEHSLGHLAAADAAGAELLELEKRRSGGRGVTLGRVVLLSTWLELSRGKLDDASRSLADAASLLEDDSVDIQLARAALLRGRGEPAQALRLYREALTTLEGERGVDHPGLASTLSSIAGLERELGDPGASEELCRRGLTLAEPVLRPHTPVLAMLHAELASSMMARGRERWAMRSVELARERAWLADGSASLWTPWVLVTVAGLQLRANRLDEAEADARAALAELERIFGLGHPALWHGLSALADCCRALGKSAEAHRLQERADRLVGG